MPKKIEVMSVAQGVCMLWHKASISNTGSGPRETRKIRLAVYVHLYAMHGDSNREAMLIYMLFCELLGACCTDRLQSLQVLLCLYFLTTKVKELQISVGYQVSD